MITGTNSWGPYTGADASGAEYPNYAPPEGTAVPSPTGALAPPQSPSGAVTTNTGRSESATQTFLGTRGESDPQAGVAQLNAPVSISSGIAAANLQTFRWQ